MSNKENTVCIFAHPDDEAFGPGGTISKWTSKENVYLVCVTNGGHPNDGHKSLGKIRKKELQNSAKILGIKKVFFLGYTDGELNNNIYHKVSGDIEKILIKLRPTKLLTFEYRGVSGHIDHVFVSFVSSYLYKKLKFVKSIYYYAAFKLTSKLMKNYFIYFPEGYSEKNVDYVEDISDFMKTKTNAIKSHKSQSKDMKKILIKLKLLPKKELFFVKQKVI